MIEQVTMNGSRTGTGNEDLKQVITRIGTLMRTLRESMRELGLEKVFNKPWPVFQMVKIVYVISLK
ncbi:hypothetical protein PROVRUST_05372 [Providencia rustigianii DSM 4541]|uniref:Uncharacterized protein n=1 Tax=Providencia rustigianii DSM 4541 TaxID=500637 RepID=D1NZL8_9GAMM|nr:hypothetical protein PROVRUST_05372 [Providencia rustigianii DSM 4541]